jgi:DNA-directed RNA polymerase subunit M/transcription elongation factor TFIIS
MENKTGFTCNTCGKVFETEEEFLNRHNKNKKNPEENQQKDNLKE